MTAKIIIRKKEYIIHHGSTIRKALEKLNIHSEAVITIKNGEMVTDDQIILEGDEIRLVFAISGG
jgi:sulfur carrier protein ThiS